MNFLDLEGLKKFLSRLLGSITLAFDALEERIKSVEEGYLSKGGGTVEGTLHTDDVYVGGFDIVGGSAKPNGDRGALRVNGETELYGRLTVKNVLEVKDDNGRYKEIKAGEGTFNGTLRAKNDFLANKIKPEEEWGGSIGNAGKKYEYLHLYGDTLFYGITGMHSDLPGGLDDDTWEWLGGYVNIENDHDHECVDDSVFPLVPKLAELKQDINNLNNLVSPIKSAINPAPKNLGEAFAEEIADYENVWDWLSERRKAQNFEGINPGDYIVYEIQRLHWDLYDSQDWWEEDETFYILGIVPDIDTGELFVDLMADSVCRSDPDERYYGCGNIGYSNNNGTAAQPCPYLLCHSSSPTLGIDCMGDFKDYAVEKTAYLETRYEAGKALSDSNGYKKVNLGKFWHLSEYEIFGETIYGTPVYGRSGCEQYEAFRRFPNLRKKNSKYWTSTLAGNSLTDAVCVNTDGMAATASAVAAKTHVYYRFCFRI